MTREEAVQHFGSVIKLSRVIGVSPQCIYQWRKGMPLQHQMVVEQVTQGALKADVPAVPVQAVAPEA